MGTAKLKPCPLCGREPELIDLPDELAANGSWQIECFKCGLILETFYVGEGYERGDKRSMLTLAVRRWNRRKSA
jgi:hypothetical protein